MSSRSHITRVKHPSNRLAFILVSGTVCLAAAVYTLWWSTERSVGDFPPQISDSLEFEFVYLGTVIVSAVLSIGAYKLTKKTFGRVELEHVIGYSFFNFVGTSLACSFVISKYVVVLC